MRLPMILYTLYRSAMESYLIEVEYDKNIAVYNYEKVNKR